MNLKADPNELTGKRVLAGLGALSPATMTIVSFVEASNARQAIERYLFDSAAGLSETTDGCMVTLSAVGGEGHLDLGARVAAARAQGFEQIKARIKRGQADGDVPSSADVHALARFVQCLQNGMSILARDGATRRELESVAETGMLGWDARVTP